ncbi:MAG: ATP-binding protein [Candidatus Algichlamydia australiensis]|nr:ATP-binding protein [Chlamydiales bacterium]
MKKPLFIGRDQHLAKLNKLFKRKSASLVVVRGRRRIGKSRLIDEFCKDHKTLRFTGLAPTEKTTKQNQREEFARQLEEVLDFPGLRADDWGDLFSLLAKQTRKGPIVIVFDEISWMGSLDPTFMGKLKILWDTEFSKNPELIFILCGSVSSWIEKNIISSTSFFGRICQKIQLEELTLHECNELLNANQFKGSVLEKLMLLGITGGVPWYLELIDPELSADENIKELCFKKDGILFDEFRRIFHDLFGKRSHIYQKIVRIIADGPCEYKEIAAKLNYPSGGPLSDYLNDLVLSGYVEKNHTWSIKTGRESKLFHYRLCDHYLRFYLKYIEPNRNQVEKNRFITSVISSLPGWGAMMGFQFENLVLHNRNLVLKELKIDYADIIYDNPFFQRKTSKQSGCQIDYLIQTRYNTLYVCEIKFSKNPVSPKVFSEIKEKITRIQVPKGFSCIPVLIHINGCSESLEGIRTVDFGDLVV